MSEKKYYIGAMGNEDGRKGCFISRITAIVLVLLVIAALVIVGLLVHFVPSDGTSSSSASEDQDSGGEDATEEPGEWLGRVPEELEPVHYRVKLTTYLDEEDGDKRFTFDGEVEVQIKIKQDTKEIKIHSNVLEIDDGSVTLLDDGEENVEVSSKTYDSNYQFYVVTTKKSLDSGRFYQLKMKFVGKLEADLAGLYRSLYITSSGEERYIATTQFQPTDARKAFPCFDEPALKATFDVVLVNRPTRRAVSNMPAKETKTIEINGEDWTETYFETTVKMSTYLLAFVISDLEYKENTTANNVTVRVWARKEVIDTVDYALDVGVRILDYFEEYFGVDFPLPKQDMMAVPDFAAGAMENWGLIIYRETALLFNEDVSSETNKQRVAVVVSHELAHQWFGNLVTPSWWDDLWLNEGFASYVEYLGVDHVEPTWKMNEQFVIEDLQNVFEIDSLGSSHPVYVPVGSPDEINEIFDTISYSKGASILRMLDDLLTTEVFVSGLTQYLIKLSFDSATSNDLWAYLTEADKGIGDNNVKDIMDTWTLQMGYPLVTIERNYDTQKAKVDQNHFLIDPDSEVSDKYGDLGYKWYVPLSYISNKDPNTKNELMEKTVVELDLNTLSEADWVLANINQKGYYRVNYDENNWNNLITQLNTDHNKINEVNRAQLLDDVFNIARAESLNTTIALELTKYLSKEKSYFPWEAILNVMEYIQDMFSRTGTYGELQEYILSLIEPIYNELGWEDSGDDHLKKYQRKSIFGAACKLGLDDCKEKATEQYTEWMTGTAPSPDLKDVVYCYGIKYGGVEEWDFAWEKYQVETDSGEKSRLQLAMSCSNEPWILNRYLNYALDANKIRVQDAAYTIRYVSKNYVGRSLAWEFFRSNYDLLYEKYGGGSFTWGRIIGDLTEQMNTEYDLKELKEVGEEHPDMGSGQRSYEQSIEYVQANIKWMARNLASVDRWLKDRNA